MSEKLLPIVPGCLALVIKGSCVGKTVKVMSRMGADDSFVLNGESFRVSSRTSRPVWRVCDPGGGTLPGRDGRQYTSLATSEHYLMRIDGHDPDIDMDTFKKKFADSYGK